MSDTPTELPLGAAPPITPRPQNSGLRSPTPAPALRSSARMPLRPKITIRTPANRFDVNLDLKPAHISYQWWAESVMGQEQQQDMIDAQSNGWEPVPAGRHPELTGAAPNSLEPIRIGGQILMQRPQEITDYVREMEKRVATEQVSSQFERLQLGASKGGAAKTVKLERTMVQVEDGE